MTTLPGAFDLRALRLLILAFADFATVLILLETIRALHPALLLWTLAIACGASIWSHHVAVETFPGTLDWWALFLALANLTTVLVLLETIWTLHPALLFWADRFFLALANFTTIFAQLKTMHAIHCALHLRTLVALANFTTLFITHETILASHFAQCHLFTIRIDLDITI